MNYGDTTMPGETSFQPRSVGFVLKKPNKTQRKRAMQECKYFSQVANTHTKQESYAQRAQTSADPEDPDFGLWTPGSEA